MKTLSIGAEAIIKIIDNNTLVKNRVKKNYRIKEIDLPLRKRRTKNEFKLLKRAALIGLNVPKVSNLNKFSFNMEYLHGIVLRDYDNIIKLFSQVGKQINTMHENNIIHGDLTTSNMIFKDDKVFFIDFSLGSISSKLEDKAVDLHLIKQALIAKHNKVWKKCFNLIIKNYKNKHVLERLKSVEKRGRKK